MLHVIRYCREQLDMQIDATSARVTSRVKAGNLYVNRSVIGAIVGVQPPSTKRLRQDIAKRYFPRSGFWPRISATTTRSKAIARTGRSLSANLMPIPVTKTKARAIVVFVGSVGPAIW